MQSLPLPELPVQYFSILLNLPRHYTEIFNLIATTEQIKRRLYASTVVYLKCTCMHLDSHKYSEDRISP